MPTNSSTRVTSGDPSTVEVTVRDEPTGGGNAAELDVLIVVDLTFATPVAGTRQPAMRDDPLESGEPVSTVAWKAQRFQTGQERKYSIQLAPAAGATVARAPVTVIVTGVSEGRPYFYMEAPVVAFPAATSQPQP